MADASGKGSSPRPAQVLAAVKDDNRDYKPDAKSRTAWELATHLATADIWFIDSIVNGRSSSGTRTPRRRPRTQFTSVNDVVEFYKKTFPRS